MKSQKYLINNGRNFCSTAIEDIKPMQPVTVGDHRLVAVVSRTPILGVVHRNEL
jgi:hypothetical protein